MTFGVVVVGFLALAAVAYVLGPLRWPSAAPDEAEPIAGIEAQERKARALTAILDVQEEALVGKLTADEYATLRGDYEREAVLAIEALDRLDAGPHADDPLEAEVAEMRKRLACPSCGAPRAAGGTCGRCGT
jgi:hypothetical protein